MREVRDTTNEHDIYFSVNESHDKMGCFSRKKKTCFPKLVKEDLCKLGTTQKIIKMAKDLFYRKH
jgi:hypothetical protein